MRGKAMEWEKANTPVVVRAPQEAPQRIAAVPKIPMDISTTTGASMDVSAAVFSANDDILDDDSMLWAEQGEIKMPELGSIPLQLLFPEITDTNDFLNQQRQSTEEDSDVVPMNEDAAASIGVASPLGSVVSSLGDDIVSSPPVYPHSTTHSQAVDAMKDIHMPSNSEGGASPTTPLTQFSPSTSFASSSRWTSWENLSQVLNSNELPNSDVLKDRRQRNRASMQRSRQRKKDELQQMKATIAQLEKQYETLCLRAGEDDHGALTIAGNVQNSPRRVIMLTKQLRAEKALLHAVMPNYDPWKIRLQEILKLMPYANNSSSNPSNDEVKILESHEAELVFRFQPVNEEFVMDRILDNTQIVHQIHHQLDPGDPNMGVDRMQLLEWDVRRRLVGTETHYLFTKRFTCGLSAYGMLEKTWHHFKRFEHAKRVETDMLRLDLLQVVNSNVEVFGRDVRSNDDRSVFRSLFLHYKMETSMEWINPANPSGPKLSASGYTLGVHSFNPEQSSHTIPFGISDDKKLLWADMMFSVNFLDVSTTEEPVVEVRWVGKSNYKTLPLALRNNTDTVTTILRWELSVIAPALNLVSLSFPATGTE